MAAGRIYFKGLNGIRAIAALIVVVAHIGQNLPLFGLPEGSYYKWRWQSFAVTLFFVLSGYLITFLLLEEKERTGSVALRRFYMRRILRIWPLYYLAILIAVCLYHFAPVTGVTPLSPAALSLYLTLLANVAMHFQVSASPLFPLWSVGVEEQFYAFWPVIMRRSSNVVKALLLVIALDLAAKAAVVPLKNQIISALVADTRIDCMAIGGLGAVILRRESWLLRYLYAPATQLACWLLLLYSTAYKPVHLLSSIDHELYAVVFMIIILNVSTNAETLVDLERPVFDILGKISYGLYIYHMVVLFCLGAVVKPMVAPTWQWYCAIYAAVLSLTTLVAWISFRFFEGPFLRLKGRFEVVHSSASSAGLGAVDDAVLVSPLPNVAEQG